MIKTIIFDLGNVIVKVNWENFYKKLLKTAVKLLLTLKNTFKSLQIEKTLKKEGLVLNNFMKDSPVI